MDRIKISDNDIFRAVNEVKRQYATDYPVKDGDVEALMSWLAAVSAKTTLNLLGANVGMPNREMVNSDIDSAERPFPLIFAEWAQQFVLKTHFDKVLAIMLYLREHKGADMVNTADVIRMYEKARWKRPANMADVFAKGAERIYFTEAEETTEEGLKMWQMTRTGYDYVLDKRMEI
jgi:hypothetical protein